jgi:hypothetical protein
MCCQPVRASKNNYWEVVMKYEEDALKALPKTITLYPYRDEKGNPVEGWPQHLNPEWKDVGFTVKYPTMGLIKQLSQHGVKMKQGKDGNSTFTYQEIDLVALAKYYCHTVIQGWEGVENGTSEAVYNPDWLFKYMDRFPFLFNRLVSEYRNLIDQVKEETEKEESDFLST